MGTDRDWEKWGARNPYFGVLSAEEFQAHQLDKDAKDRFFRSGEEHVQRVLEIVRNRFDSKFKPASVLDFGSGVGRLAIPFSRHAHRVVGVDISQSMIAEATRNCEVSNVNNVAFKLSDDHLSEVIAQFDLVHSYIVLQHIDWIRGRRILQSLAERVTHGGYLAVQLLTSCKAPKRVRALVRLRYMCPPANWARNIMRRRPVFEPAMQLHVYDLATTIEDLKARNFHDFVQITEASDDQPDFTSTFIFARRESD